MTFKKNNISLGNCHNNQAFTLIEMSIVLVIIALIIAASLAGDTMIKNSEIRSIITEYNSYVEAINNFKTKYGQLPGDFTKASSFFATCDSTGSSNASYCNGNGDGLIEPGYMNGPGGTAAPYEGRMAWRHLALDGFINGAYDGVTGSSAGGTLTATSFPSSGRLNAIWAFDGTNSYSASFYSSTNNGLANVLSLVGYKSVNGAYSYTNSLLPSEAYNIDRKIDDAMPNSGRVAAFHYYMGQTSTSPVCTTSPTIFPPAATNSYNFASIIPSCTMYFYFSDN
jgi:prepilin-type N-terminal cleavage/methylation domain-containing protein